MRRHDSKLGVRPPYLLCPWRTSEVVNFFLQLSNVVQHSFCGVALKVFPFGHFLQAVLKRFEYSPGAHVWHLVLPRAEYKPEAHCLQSVLAEPMALLYLPASQGLQSTAFSAPAYFPAGQLMHIPWGLNFPWGQGLQFG